MGRYLKCYLCYRNVDAVACLLFSIVWFDQRVRGVGLSMETGVLIPWHQGLSHVPWQVDRSSKNILSFLWNKKWKSLINSGFLTGILVRVILAAVRNKTPKYQELKMWEVYLLHTDSQTCVVVVSGGFSPCVVWRPRFLLPAGFALPSGQWFSDLAGQ